MRVRCFFALVITLALAADIFATTPTPSEQALVDQFVKKTEAKHNHKLGWVSAHFAYDRINRHNDYNSLASHVNQSLSGGKFSWLSGTAAFGAEVGMTFNNTLAWSLGGEYWLKAGQSLSGTFLYTPPGAAGPMTLTNPESKFQIMGLYTGLGYYIMNAPTPAEGVKYPAVKVAGTVGYYQVNWDLFPQFQNLNLETAQPDGSNTTFKGSAPGFSLGAGVDYPVGFYGVVLSGEASYFYLNFKNVAWYNNANQEVVASYDETPAGRVDLNLSGVRARFAIKRFFSW